MDPLLGAVVIAVLAGGKSQRMGVDKRTLRLGEETLLERACRLGETTLTQSGRVGVVVVSGSVAPRGLRVVPDRRPDRGPLEAMASVMQALAGAASRFVFFPVDMPLLCADDLARLIASDKRSLACCFAGHELPVLIAAKAALAVDEVAEGPRRSIRALLEILRPTELEAPPERHMLNANTPSDWLHI